MNTATAQRFADTQAVSTDPRRRFGYSAGVPMLTMHPKASGLDCNPIDGGRLLLFVQRQQVHDGQFDPLKGAYKRVVTQIYPQQYADEVARKFQFTEDFGYRNLPMLTALEFQVHKDADNNPVDYIDDADVYFNVVHPRLNDCPFGLFSMQPRRFGDAEWQECPTCRLNDLQSDECSERIFAASQTLDSQVLSELRAVLIDANEAAIRHITQKSGDIDAEMEGRLHGERGRAARNEIDFIHLKMLHRKPSTDQATQMFERMIEANAAAISQGLTSGLQGVQQPPKTDIIEEQDTYIKLLEEKVRKLEGESKPMTVSDILKPVEIESDATTETPIIIEGKCTATTASGEQCKMNATKGDKCGIHAGE